jgi:hypothetical protein
MKRKMGYPLIYADEKQRKLTTDFADYADFKTENGFHF